MGNLIKLSFWFNSRPGELLPFMQKFFIVFSVLLLVMAVSALVMKKQNPKSVFRKTRNRLINFGFTNGIIGLVLLFFTHEMIPLLSARLWYLIWIICMIVWLYFIIKELREIPKLREQLAMEKKLKQYIP
jgi:tryptophan-rich sensory protein